MVRLSDDAVRVGAAVDVLARGEDVQPILVVLRDSPGRVPAAHLGAGAEIDARHALRAEGGVQRSVGVEAGQHDVGVDERRRCPAGARRPAAAAATGPPRAAAGAADPRRRRRPAAPACEPPVPAAPPASRPRARRAAGAGGAGLIRGLVLVAGREAQGECGGGDGQAGSRNRVSHGSSFSDIENHFHVLLRLPDEGCQRKNENENDFHCRDGPRSVINRGDGFPPPLRAAARAGVRLPARLQGRRRRSGAGGNDRHRRHDGHRRQRDRRRRGRVLARRAAGRVRDLRREQVRTISHEGGVRSTPPRRA